MGETAANDEQLHRIRELNDRLRVEGTGGEIVCTAGFLSLPGDLIGQIGDAIRGFENFTDDNDPYGEHDCAVVVVCGQSVMFKIDYYDTDLDGLSPNPADPTVTRRVMTIMLAEEY